MANNVFRVQVGAQIGTSTITLKNDIQNILNSISTNPPKVTVGLNKTTTKAQIEADLNSITSQSKVGVALGLQGGGSIRGSSGKKITKELYGITSALSQQQAAKITLHLDVNASQKAILSELKKLNLGVNITPNNQNNNQNNSNNEYTKATKAAGALQSEILQKQKSQIGLDQQSHEYVKLNEQISALQVKLSKIKSDYLQTSDAKQRGITPDAFDDEVKGLDNVRKAQDRLAQSTERLGDKQNSAWKSAKAKSEDLQSQLDKGSSAGLEYAEKFEKLDNIYKNQTKKAGEYAEAVKNLGKEARKNGAMAESAGKKFTRMFGEKIGWSVVTIGLLKVRQALSQVYTNVVDLDTAMTELKKVTDETDETYRKFMDSAANRAKTLGATMSDTINATANFARLGYSLSDSADLADAALVYKNVGDGIATIDEASESVIATMQAFGIAAQDAMTIVDKFNEVGNNFAISSKGVGDALLRSAASMNAANNTLDETIALAAAMNTVVQDPEKVGTTLKTVSMYLRAAKTEAEDAGESTDGMAESVSKLRDELLKLTNNKVDIQLDENTYKSTYQILKELSGVWNQLADITQANILEKLAGKRNANAVSALLENFTVAENALIDSQNAAGSALAENEKYLDSINGKMDQLRATWEQLSASILSSDVIKGLLDAVRSILDVFNQMDEATGGLSSKLIAFIAVIGVSNAVLSAFKFKANDANSMLGVFLNALTRVDIKNVSKNFNGLKKAIADIAAAFNLAKTSGQGFLPTLLGLIPGGLKVVAALGAVALAVYGVYKAYQWYREKNPTLDDLRGQYDDAKQKADELSASIKTNQERISELQKLLESGSITLVEQDELNRLQQENELLDAQYQIEKALMQQRKEEIAGSARQKAADFLSDGQDIEGSYGIIIGHTNSGKQDVDQYLSDYKDAVAAIQAEYERAANDGVAVNQSLIQGQEKIKTNALAMLKDRTEEITGLIADLDPEKDAEALGELQKMLYAVELVIGGNNAAGSVFNKIINQDQFKGAADALRQLANSGELTAESLSKLQEENPKVKELIDLLVELGLFSWDNLTGLSNQLKNIGMAADEASSSMKTAAQWMESLSGAYNILSQAQQDMADTGYLSASTLETMLKDYPALSKYLVQTADGYKLTKGALDDYIASQRIECEMAFNEAQSAASALVSSEEAKQAGFTATTGTIYEQILALRQLYSVRLSEARSNALDTYGNDVIGRQLASQDASVKKYEGLMMAANDAVLGMQEAQKSLLDFDSVVNSLRRSSGSSSSSGSSKNKNKEAADAAIAILKHQFAIEKITAQQYYDGLESIENKYYKNSAANQAKYADEIRSIDEELFNGRRQLNEDWLNDQQVLAEQAAASGDEAGQKQILESMLQRVEEMIDAAHRYGLDESSDYVQELRSKLSDLQNDILDAIKDTFDEFISYMDDFDLWKGFDFSKLDVLKRELQDVIDLYDKGQLSWDAYVSSRNEIAKEMYDTQRDSLETILDLTMDMIKQEAEDQVDALDEQIDAYQKIIDLKKKMLQDTADEKDHQKAVADAVKEIAELQSKIAQLSLDDSREAAAKRADLEEQLYQKQQDLADLQNDYALDQTMDALDKTQEAFKDEKEAEKDAVEKSVDSWQKLYEKAIKRINGDWDGLYKDLMEYEREHRDSIDGPDSLVTAWKNATAAMQAYNNSFEDAYQNASSNSINPEAVNSTEARNILSKMQANSILAQQMGTRVVGGVDLHKENEKLAGDYYKLTGQKLVYNNGWRLDNSNGGLAYTVNTKPSTSVGTSGNQSGSTSGNASQGTAYNAAVAKYGNPPSGTLKIGSSGDGVKWLQYYLKQLGLFHYAVDGTFYTRTAEALKAFQKMAGLIQDGIYGSRTRAALKKYHTGGIVDGTGAINDKEVLAILQKGELVLDDVKKQNLKNMLSGIRSMITGMTSSNLSNSMASMRPALAGNTGDTFAPRINVTIQHNGEMTEADAKRYGNTIADTALDKLKNAFAKRGRS